ncbi:hypothetical protein V8E53_002158 [Lactarius tabidus]
MSKSEDAKPLTNIIKNCFPFYRYPSVVPKKPYVSWIDACGSAARCNTAVQMRLGTPNRLFSLFISGARHRHALRARLDALVAEGRKPRRARAYKHTHQRFSLSPSAAEIILSIPGSVPLPRLSRKLCGVFQKEWARKEKNKEKEKTSAYGKIAGVYSCISRQRQRVLPSGGHSLTFTFAPPFPAHIYLLQKEGKKRNTKTRSLRYQIGVDLALFYRNAATFCKFRRPVIAGASSTAPGAAICVEQENAHFACRRTIEGGAGGGNVLLDARGVMDRRGRGQRRSRCLFVSFLWEDGDHVFAHFCDASGYAISFSSFIGARRNRDESLQEHQMVLRTPSRDEMPRRRWIVLEASFLDEEEAEDDQPGFTLLRWRAEIAERGVTRTRVAEEQRERKCGAAIGLTVTMIRMDAPSGGDTLRVTEITTKGPVETPQIASQACCEDKRSAGTSSIVSLFAIEADSDAIVIHDVKTSDYGETVGICSSGRSVGDAKIWGKGPQGFDIEVRRRSSLLAVPRRTGHDQDRSHRTEVLGASSSLADRQDMKSGGMNAQAGSDAWEGPNYANGGQPLRGRWERVHPKKATKGAERGTMSQTFVNAPSMKVPFENVRTSVTLWRVRPP